MAERDMSAILERIFRIRGKQAAHGAALNELVVKPGNINKLERESKEWEEEARSNAEKDRERAQEDAKRARYPKEVLDSAPSHLRKADEMLVVAHRTRPDFLVGANSTQEVSMEYVARISEVPAALQENPDFLLREASKLYWSTNWASLTPDGAREVRELIFTTFEEIRRIHLAGAHLPPGIPALTPLSLEQNIQTADLLFGDDPDNIRRGIELFDSNNPGVITNPDLIAKLVEYQRQINAQPGIWRADIKYLESITRDLRDPAYAGVPNEETILISNKITVQIERIRHGGNGRRYVSSSERFTGMYLESGEMDDALGDFFKVTRKKMALVEKEGEINPRAGNVDANKRRLDLLLEYISSERFQADAASITNLNRLGLIPGSRQAVEYLEGIKQAPHLVSREMVNRESMMYASYGLKTVGNVEKAAEQVTGIGMQGYESVLQGYGGLVEVAQNRLATLYSVESLDSKSGEAKTIDAPTMKSMHDQVVQDVLHDAKLYESQYQESFKVPGINLRPQDYPLDKEAVETIVRDAEFCRTVTLRDAVDRLDGKSPYIDFKSANITEKFLAALDPNGWHFEKWGLLGPVARHVWQTSSRLAAKISGRDRVAQDIFEDLKRLKIAHPDQYRVRIAKLFDIDEKKPDQEIENILHHKLQRDQKSGKNRSERSIPKTFESISDYDVQDRVLVVEGEKAIADLLKAYDPFSSGWRIALVTKVIDGVYGEHVGQYIALGMRLRKAGSAVLDARTGAERSFATKGLVKELNKVAKFRPHEIMEYLSRENDNDMKVWFDANNHGSLSFFGAIFKGAHGNLTDTPQRADQFYMAIKKPFVAINEQLARKGLPPIDYSNAHLMPQQNDVLHEVCNILGIDSARYVDAMMALSGQVTAVAQINKLTTDKYLWVYTRTRFVDDARLQYLQWENYEDADKYIPIYNRHQKEEFLKGVQGGSIIAISNEFSEHGLGPADPTTRAFGDMSVAVETVTALTDSLSADPKKFQENIIKVFSNVKRYAGETMAARAAMYIAGGWLGTARTNSIDDFFFLAGVKRVTSAMQEVGGHTAPSLGLQEVEEVLESLYPGFGGRLADMDKGSFEEVDKFLKITSDSKILKDLGLERTPMYLYRLRLFIAVAAIIIAMEAGKAAQEGYKDLSGKSR